MRFGGRLICVAFGISLAILPVTGDAYFEINPDSVRSMNDVKFDDYKDFPAKWRLVTMRYRQDSGEMRVVYANEAAWQGLNSLNPKYPDGAAFAKIGAESSHDPSFTSSIMPTSVSRVQLMVKDAKKYKDADGWGYALFDSRGVVFPEDVKTQTASCVACHRLVPERDFVFSRKFDFNGFTKSAIDDMKASSLTFKPLERGRLPKLLAASVDKSFAKVESLTGPIAKNGFSGTLDEIQPTLKEHAARLSLPAVLVLDDKSFSAVVPIRSRSKKTCGKGEVPFKSVIVFNGRSVRDHDFCVQK